MWDASRAGRAANWAAAGWVEGWVAGWGAADSAHMQRSIRPRMQQGAHGLRHWGQHGQSAGHMSSAHGL